MSETVGEIGARVVQFGVGASALANINALASSSGFLATVPFHDVALSTTPAPLVNLPQAAGGAGTHQGGAIIGIDLFALPAGFLAAAIAEIDLFAANVFAPAARLPIKLGILAAATGQVLAYQSRGLAYCWLANAAASSPAINAVLPSPIAGTLTISGALTLMMFP